MIKNNYKKAQWINSTNVYEVNVRQYTPEGTLNAFAAHLPRLRDMGVETLWFMPLTLIAQKNRKGSMGSYYACKSYTAIDPEFGTAEDFKQLVQDAHNFGFKVVVDWVANHTGWDHEWTITNPEYYKWDEKTNDFMICHGMDDIIQLDFDNRALRKTMIETMRYWLDTFNLDGFRCDLAYWVPLGFWHEARTALDANRPLFWMAECDALNDAQFFEVFDVCYTWKFMHESKVFYENQIDLHQLKQNVLIPQANTCGNTHIPMWFTTNHDENSWNGTEYEKYGNLAKGLAVFSFTWNGMPLIYCGQELPLLKRLAFFDKDPIHWSNELALHGFYKTLLHLKTNNAALRAAEEQVQTHLLQPTDNRVLAYLRANGVDHVLTIINTCENKVAFSLEGSWLPSMKEIFTGKVEATSGLLEMEPWGYKVFVS